MRNGDVISVNAVTVTQYDNEGKFAQSQSWKPPKGEQFMLLVLGSRPKAGDDFDPAAALRSLGWTSPDFPEKSVEADSEARGSR